MDQGTSPAPAPVTPPTTPKFISWTGRVISGLICLMLLGSAGMKFAKPEGFIKDFVEKFGYKDEHAIPIGLVEVGCVVLYAIPQTSVLGAILLTGYLGGATATHVRVDDPFIAPVIIGVIVWAGLFLRDSRVRSLIPIRWKHQ